MTAPSFRPAARAAGPAWRSTSPSRCRRPHWPAEAKLAAADADTGAEQDRHWRCRARPPAPSTPRQWRMPRSGHCCARIRRSAAAGRRAPGRVRDRRLRTAASLSRAGRPPAASALAFAVVQQQHFAAVGGQCGNDVLGGDLFFHPLQPVGRAPGPGRRPCPSPLRPPRRSAAGHAAHAASRGPGCG
jgi:hypothetical protein